MRSTNAVFIGEGSLLVRCAQAWRDAGHLIAQVITANAEVAQWARDNGVPVSLDSSVPAAGEFDYLFSIANLRMLPAAQLSRARQLAINFHDGPLPRYAGLNAPAWALLAGERSHGITWHEMTAQADAGRIVRQVLFDLEPGETALSLNARCYEAGLSAFVAMAADISRGSLVLTAQPAGRQYFARDRRPQALATLDFLRPARELAALVRALDFGSYANPLARPKVWLGNDVVLPRSAHALPGSGAAPGTIVQVEGDAVRVATAQDDLVLQGCIDCLGQPATGKLRVGAVLPQPDARLRQRLDAETARAGEGESFWSEALRRLAPVELPFPRKLEATTSPASELLSLPLEGCTAGPRTVAAFFAWLSALTGQERVTALYRDAELGNAAHGLEAWLSGWVPLTLETTLRTQSDDAVRAADRQIHRCRAAGPYPRDLPLRLGEKVAGMDDAGRIRVCLSGESRAVEDADMALIAASNGGPLRLQVDVDVYPTDIAVAMAAQLAHWLRAFDTAKGPVAGISLVTRENHDRVAAATQAASTAASVRELIAQQAARTPTGEAISCRGEAVSYAQLEQRAAALAARLVQRGARAGTIVGVCLERSADMIVAVLAIWQTGAAYLPLDAEYPADRIAFMIGDSQAPLVITDAAKARALRIAGDKAFLLDQPERAPETAAIPAAAIDAQSPAYMIYTSGSTGRPKGVVVTHGNVLNFFAGMDARIPHDPPGRWLAVTSLSFDISVLELFWTLARGFTVVVHTNAVQAERQPPRFSLFYFAADNGSPPDERYKLLLEGAKFADREGFEAIWTPERHFHAFGGLYPNPAVTSAAIAAMTTRLQIRAGSCVLPLHHPIRVAEEWAFVDNISRGRVGVSFASGWQPNDFVLAPGAFADRKNTMVSSIDIVRRLWRGEKVPFEGPLGKPVDIQTLPRPVQEELPIWVTAAGNPETFQQAGQMGCHLLTHLLGQKIEDVAQKLGLYRQAWRQAGHAGEGRVTVMLHTFVGQDDDEVRETVRGPMKEYLRSSVDLIKQAAWSFPTFVERGAARGQSPVEIMDSAPLSAEEMDALLEHAFNRYYGTSALFGTPARCLALVEKLHAAGVDEIACLIDFGIHTDTVLEHLRDLKVLMDAAGNARPLSQRASVADDLQHNAITHFQCTPSMASMLVADAAGRAGLSRLQVMMVGGEALPVQLARQLTGLVPGRLLNMYGPTETTIWSTTCELAGYDDFVALGEPIRNTRLAIHTPWGMEAPHFAAGELLIGGDGVAQGYWQRPELTAERFLVDGEGCRWYRTGDLVRRHGSGRLEFLGRVDQQVKIRGHRIELGEIENALMRQPGVRQAAVVARDTAAGGKRLEAFIAVHAGRAVDTAAVRAALAQELPDVMVPASVATLPALPLTPNGKIDRRALPQSRPEVVVKLAIAPQSPVEKTIAAIWQDVLGLPQVGMTDNFFDLGGHSLLVVQVQRRLREACGCEVSITDMFRLPTIRALAAHLGAGQPVRSAVDDGRSRANARRLMRSRATAATTSDHPAA